MKNTLLLLTTLICVSFLYAQNNTNNIPLTNEEFFTQAELVVEGNFIRVVATYDTKGNGKYEDCYRISAYKVNKIYKGKQYSKGDTIFIVDEGGILGEESRISGPEYASYYTPAIFSKNGINCGINEYSTSIFFLDDSDFPDDENSKYYLKKKFRYLSNGGMIVCGDIIAGLNDLVFRNRTDFYNYIMQFEGYRIPEPELIPEKQMGLFPDSVLHEIYRRGEAIMDSVRNASMKDTIQIDKKKVLQETKSPSDYNTLTLQLANTQVTNSGGKCYFEFDVMASSNNPNIYFSAALLYIMYDSDLAGANIVANNKVTVSKGAHFNNANDYQIFTHDYFPMVLSINIYPYFLSLNRVPLNNIPTVMMHFKIELLNSIVDASQFYISFLSKSYEGTHATYTLTSFAPYSGYDIYYDKTFLNSFLPNITTNMSSISKPAGIGEVLTIEGKNFGMQKGVVFFKAADNGGQTYLKGVQDQYIDSWSNSQIKVKVPSKVHNGYGGTQYIGTGGAGTGTVYIRTSAGDTCVSNTELQIPYSVWNDTTTISGNVEIQRVYLTRKVCEYDFLFILDPYFKTNPLRIDIIEKALRDWSALTGLKLALERDSTGSLVYVNIPFQDNIEGKYIITKKPSGAMGTINKINNVTINGFKYLYCDAGLNYAMNSHIAINDKPNLNPQPFTWNYDTLSSVIVPPGFVSFYQAFMHELGHILLLHHVNDALDLMYPMITSNVPIINLKPDDTPVFAVKQTVAASRAIPWPAGFVKVPKITIVGYNSPLICNFGGRTITLSSNYATGNLWEPGGATTQTIQVTSGGTYSLKNTDNICEIADTVSLTLSTLKASCNAIPVKCFGENNGSIITNLGNSTHPPFTYHWTGNGIDTTTQNLYNLTAGTYYLKLSNSAGCIKNDTVHVTQPEELFVYFSQTPTTYDATVVGGTPSYEYYWSYKLATQYQCPRISFPNLPSVPLSYEQPPCYLQLTVTDANGCQITGSPTKSIMMPESITHTTIEEITLYPNPTMGSFSISNITDATLYLYSMLGSHIKTFEHVSHNETIHIGNLSNGVYFLKIIDGNTIKNKKLILSK